MNNWLREEFRSLREKQEEMNATLVRNTTSLELHMKRSDALEKQIKPLKEHVDFVNKAAKVSIAILGVLVGLNRLGVI